MQDKVVPDHSGDCNSRCRVGFNVGSCSLVLANILMILLIFTVSAEDVVVPAAATMSSRGGCIVDCFHVGIVPDVARNILRSQDV